MHIVENTSNTRKLTSRLDQCTISSQILLLASEALSSAKTSSSSGTSLSFSSLTITRLAIKWIAPTSANVWIMNATASVIAETLAQFPPSPDLSSNAPATTHGTTKKNTGRDPNSIAPSGSRRIPVVTLTGQSGPPHKTATFEAVIPGSTSMSRIAFISIEFTPTSLLTQTLLDPSFSPITFCWIVIASNFRPKHIAIVKTRTPP
mmetsp:Transcript_5972/g.9336  ORF Transcript_5972/g.9336 Transcript_5972/m.9336 type:complete len:205 (+) Transcript_5972:578-1192(+)